MQFVNNVIYIRSLRPQMALEIQQLQYIDKLVECTSCSGSTGAARDEDSHPRSLGFQMPGTQTSAGLGTAPVRQVAQAEIVVSAFDA